MTRYGVVLAIIGLFLNVLGCSKDKPRVRVNNQRVEITDVQLKRQSGNTYNFNDVGGNSTTSYVEVDVSNYEVDAKPEGVSSGSATTFFLAEEDQTYTVVVLNTTPPTVRVDRP